MLLELEGKKTELKIPTLTNYYLPIVMVTFGGFDHIIPLYIKGLMPRDEPSSFKIVGSRAKTKFGSRGRK